MSRAQRRRVDRALAKAEKKGVAPDFTSGPPKTIRLQNPVADHFKAFVIGNAVTCQRIPPHDTKEERCDSAECAVVVEENQCKGQTLTLCGAGPSLAEEIAGAPKTDQLWGCNSALTWLIDNGYQPNAGITVDQTPAMLAEWESAPDVEYLLASTVHPHLTEWLIQHGRKTRFFHNYVGIREADVEWDGVRMCFEDWLYSTLFPATVRAGSGLNTLNRALDVAMFMGFRHIYVLGADCALRASRPSPDAPFGSPEHRRWLEEDVVMHANGDHATVHGATAQTFEGEIDGRYWVTKPDMMISAVWLVKTVHKNPGRITLLGDTLPNALIDKPDEYLKRLPSMGDDLAFT